MFGKLTKQLLAVTLGLMIALSTGLAIANSFNDASDQNAVKVYAQSEKGSGLLDSDEGPG